MRARAIVGSVLVTLWLLPAVALADAQVTVRLTDHEGRPVDGEVTLTAGNVTRRCRTTASRCTLTVPAGTYTVSLRPVRGSAPAPRTLRVPSTGTVSLALTAGPPRIEGTTAQTSGTAVRQATPTSPTRATGTRTSPVVRRATPRAVRRATSPRTTRAVRRATTPTTLQRATAAPSPSPAVGTGGGAVEGGSTGGTREPESSDAPSTSTTLVVDTTSVFGRLAEPRDLSSGERLCVQGRVLDGAGRPVDATLAVGRSGQIVGQVRTTAGQFSIYDLPAGTYEVSLRSSRGTTSRSTLTVGSTTSRPTLRVP